jgi:L-alanine-DL-glutamate epimerase-like enolase superfamily enzyme
VECEPWAPLHEAPPVKDGNLVLSDKPGLGLELDEAALVRFTLA